MAESHEAETRRRAESHEAAINRHVDGLRRLEDAHARMQQEARAAQEAAVHHESMRAEAERDLVRCPCACPLDA